MVSTVKDYAAHNFFTSWKQRFSCSDKINGSAFLQWIRQSCFGNDMSSYKNIMSWCIQGVPMQNDIFKIARKGTKTNWIVSNDTPISSQESTIYDSIASFSKNNAQCPKDP